MLWGPASRYAGAASVAIALQFALAWDTMPQRLAHLAIHGAAPIAVFAGVRRQRPAKPLPWLVLGAALTANAVSSAFWVLNLAGVAPSLTYAANRAAALVAVTLVLTATVLVVAVRHPGQDRDGLLDCGILLAAAILVVAAGVAAEWLSPDRIVRTLITALMLAAVVVFVRTSFTRGPRPPSLLLLLTAAVLVLAGNLFLALQGIGSRPPRWLDICWLLAPSLAATAVLHPSVALLTTPLPSPERRPTPLRLVMLGAALLVNPAVAMAASFRQPVSSPGVVVGVAALTLLVLWRIGRLLLERERIQAELLHAQRRFRSLVQHAFDVIAVLDGDGSLLYASPSLSAVLGRPVESCLGLHLSALVHPDDAAALGVALRDIVTAPEDPSRVEVRLRHADGTLRWGDLSLINRLGDPSVAGIVVNLRDVTDRKRAEAELAHLALHDPLTGLPNRVSLMRLLEVALHSYQRRSEGIALLFIDLNGFKAVNDSYGHATGDRLLVAAGQRLRRALRPADTLARLGGDEFVVLTSGVAEAEQAVAVADRLHESLAAPFSWPGLEVTVGCSIGIAMADPVRPDLEGLLAAADRAMYEAKQQGVPTALAGAQLNPSRR